jgi:spermidine/putrescine transport system permease protein
MSTVLTSPALDRPPARKKAGKWTRFILPVFTGGMIFYLTSPVILMIVYSFNKIAGERQVAKFTCCTLEWWRGILDVQSLNDSLVTSLKVAFPSALIATILGTLIGLVLGRYYFRGRALTNFIIFLAIAVPEIVLGSSLKSLFVQFNIAKPLGLEIPEGVPTILLSHIGFSIAFVAIVVRARVQGLDRAMEDAAQDLFATPPQAFFKVTFPLILPGIVGGFLLAFVLSLDDFIITNFVNGSVNTFPTWVYGTAKIGPPPQVNVWGTVLFGAGLLTALFNLLKASISRKGA